MRKDLRERLGKEWLFFDGGMGTLLQEKGLKGGELPERWNLTHPEIIRDLHIRYLEAGVDVFNANTFGLNSLKFPGEVQTLAELILEKLWLTRRARLYMRLMSSAETRKFQN